MTIRYIAKKQHIYEKKISLQKIAGKLHKFTKHVANTNMCTLTLASTTLANTNTKHQKLS